MKTLALSLLFLSSSAFATESPILNNQLTNPKLYTNHHIVITKEENHKFLFIPYKKLVVINDVVLQGYTASMNNNVDIPYISSVTIDSDKKPIHTMSNLQTGISFSITQENNNLQNFNFVQANLIKLENFTLDDLNIQLPTIHTQSFSIPFTTQSFKKTWTDSEGNTYHLSYFGEKNSIKS